MSKLEFGVTPPPRRDDREATRAGWREAQDHKRKRDKDHPIPLNELEPSFPDDKPKPGLTRAGLIKRPRKQGA